MKYTYIIVCWFIVIYYYSFFLDTHTTTTTKKNKSVPKAGIRFGLNSFIKEKLRDENGKLSASKNFVAGLGAGVTEGMQKKRRSYSLSLSLSLSHTFIMFSWLIALVIVAPVETVKTKVSIHSHILKKEI